MLRPAALCVVLLAPAALAQTSELYINQYDSAGMVVVQGGVVVRSWNTLTAGENALAVAGTIRTGGNRWFGSGLGYEYDLKGNPLGPVYSTPAAGNWFDGTTDGVAHNYAVQHNGDYNLYRFNREWGGAEVLFSVGFATSGIAYDASDDTFWVTDSLSRLVRQLDMSGNVLGSFLANDGPFAYGIALDPADGTLWVGGFGSSVIYQYDKAGHFLASLSVPGIGNAYGMEFDMAEAPCAADCNGDGTVDCFDFLCFQGLVSTGNPAADCNGDGSINIFDFLCFQGLVTQGC
jgi:hypothetical protein